MIEVIAIYLLAVLLWTGALAGATGLWFCIDDTLASILHNPALGGLKFGTVFPILAVLGFILSLLRPSNS